MTVLVLLKQKNNPLFTKNIFHSNEKQVLQLRLKTTIIFFTSLNRLRKSALSFFMLLILAVYTEVLRIKQIPHCRALPSIELKHSSNQILTSYWSFWMKKNQIKLIYDWNLTCWNSCFFCGTPCRVFTWLFDSESSI